MDGTCEEYESIACNNKYEIESKQSSTTTGLHARMAKLANSTGPTKALQMKKNANFKSKTQREDKPQKHQPKVNPLQLTQGSLVSSRSATCSPAMGGRKTIMSLPNRIQSGGGTACTQVSKMNATQATNVATLTLQRTDSESNEFAEPKAIVVEPLENQMIPHQSLPIISEQNESLSKPTSA